MDKIIEIEESWTEQNEKYFLDVKEECENKAFELDKASHISKKKYNCVSIPSIILPITFSVINPYIDREYGYVNSILLASVSVLNTVNSFYNYGKKVERYSEYSNKYAEVASMIALELVKGKQFRTSLDVFMERVTTKINNLNTNCPYL